MADRHRWHDSEHPPWGECFNAGNGVWFQWIDGKVHLWHWCDRSVIKQKDTDRLPEWYEFQWVLVGVSAHTQLAGPPITLAPTELTLDPSVYWPQCCNKHGYLKQGNWEDC